MGQMNITDPVEGHIELHWSPDDKKATDKARKRFNAEIKKGRRAYRLETEEVVKKGEEIEEFDPKAGEIIFDTPASGG